MNLDDRNGEGFEFVFGENMKILEKFEALQSWRGLPKEFEGERAPAVESSEQLRPLIYRELKKIENFDSYALEKGSLEGEYGKLIDGSPRTDFVSAEEVDEEGVAFRLETAGGTEYDVMQEDLDKIRERFVEGIDLDGSEVRTIF